jgi:hypothetical protein
MTVAAKTGERETMVIDLAEHRLKRQLRSAFTMPGPRKPGPIDASVVLTWRKVSASAHLMVDPRNGARAVIRDTGAEAGRFLWSVLTAGEMDPMSEGRTDDLAQAQPLAEAALRAYAENQFAVFNGHTRNVKPR